MSNLASSMMNEKAQPQAPAPAYPGPPPNAANPAQPQSPYVPPIQTQGNPPQQYPVQQPPQAQYYPQQYPAGQYPAVQPQFYPTAGVYAQGSIGPQSGFQTAPAQAVYVMGPAAQYQQQLFTMCANGNHDVVTKYGMVGILTAVFCFPIGLLALLVDKERRCVRCGALVNV
ncbi:hypothetical protein V8D89_011366 [Ganoderma adspersum]